MVGVGKDEALVEEGSDGDGLGFRLQVVLGFRREGSRRLTVRVGMSRAQIRVRVQMGMVVGRDGVDIGL